MKHHISLLLIAILFTFPNFIFAHGNVPHVLGTVTETTQDRIVVTTPAGESVSLTIQANTIFEYNGITTKTARPAVGDRVVAEAEKVGDQLVAQKIRFATPKSK